MRNVRLEMEVRWLPDLVEVVTDIHCSCGASSAGRLRSIIMRPDGGAPLQVFECCCTKARRDELMLFLELSGATVLVRRIPPRPVERDDELMERIQKGLGAVPRPRP